MSRKLKSTEISEADVSKRSTSIKDRDFTDNVNKMKDEVSVGDILSYPQLCEYFDFKKTKSNQRKIQLNEIQRYIGLEKVNSKYMITEFYNSPLAKPAKHSKYVNYIEYILLDYLININDKATHTKRRWYEILGLTNHNFNAYHGSPDHLLKKIEDDINIDNVTVKNILDYYKISSESIRSIFKYALKSLEETRRLIFTNKVYYVRYSSDYDYYPATTEDVRDILSIQNDCLHELGVSFLPQLFYKKNDKGEILVEDYYNLVNERFEQLHEKGAGFFEALEITPAHPENLKRDKDNIGHQLEKIDEFKHLLNQASIDKINHNIDKNYGKDKDLLLTMCYHYDTTIEEDIKENEKIKEQLKYNKMQRKTATILNEKLINIDADIL